MENIEKEYERMKTSQGVAKMKNYFLDIVKKEAFKKEVLKIKDLFNKAKTLDDFESIEIRIKYLCHRYKLDHNEWLEMIELYIRDGVVPEREYPDLCKFIEVTKLDSIFSEDYELIKNKNKLIKKHLEKQNKEPLHPRKK